MPFIIIILLIVAFLGAVLSLQGILKSKQIHKKASEELQQGRVLFQAQRDYTVSSEGDDHNGILKRE